MPRALLSILGLVGFTPLLAAADDKPKALPPAAKQVIDFARDIQPIFARACITCHGPDKQRGGLRLDDGVAAQKGGNGGAVIKPGDAAGSRLLKLVAGLDEELKMPPEGRTPLSAEESGRLRAWIEPGAKWPQTAGGAIVRAKSDHWSFQPIQRPTPPEVRQRAWV